MANIDLVAFPEASALTRLKVSTLRAWVLKRRVPYVKLGGRVFFRRSDLEKLIADSVVPADHPGLNGGSFVGR